MRYSTISKRNVCKFLRLLVSKRIYHIIGPGSSCEKLGLKKIEATNRSSNTHSGNTHLPTPEEVS